MLSEKKFYAFFPEAKLIKDDALRQKSFEAFADAAEMGGWTEDTIERCPSAVAEFVDSPATQIRHLQDSIQLSLMIGTYLKEHYGRVHRLQYGLRAGRCAPARSGQVHRVRGGR